MRFARGQGATEYLVLLAVVLIIALVGIALLGFFPGTASDAQIAESQLYWQSATPVAITAWDARYYTGTGEIIPYLRIRNNGAYPIRLLGVIGADGGKAWQIYNGSSSPAMSDYFYMAPGEEKYFGVAWIHGGSFPTRQLDFSTAATWGGGAGGATSVCQNSSASPGTVWFKSFGFEYVAYIENQQLTNREIGKALIIKCREPY